MEEVLPTLREQGISVYTLSETSPTQGINSLCDKISQASDQPMSRELRANVTIKSTALYIYTSGTTGTERSTSEIHIQPSIQCFTATFSPPKGFTKVMLMSSWKVCLKLPLSPMRGCGLPPSSRRRVASQQRTSSTSTCLSITVQASSSGWQEPLREVMILLILS